MLTTEQEAMDLQKLMMQSMDQQNQGLAFLSQLNAAGLMPPSSSSDPSPSLESSSSPPAADAAAMANFLTMMNAAGAGMVDPGMAMLLDQLMQQQLMAGGGGLPPGFPAFMPGAPGVIPGSAPKDAYCELCDKSFCNRYFLKEHRKKKHGIDDGGSPVKSAPGQSPEESKPSTIAPVSSAGPVNGTPASVIVTRESATNGAPCETEEPEPKRVKIEVSEDTSAPSSMLDSLFAGSSSAATTCDECYADCGSIVGVVHHKAVVHGREMPKIETPKTSPPAVAKCGDCDAVFDNPAMLHQHAAIAHNSFGNLFNSLLSGGQPGGPFPGLLFPTQMGVPFSPLDNASTPPSKPPPKRSYSSAGKNYCDVCNKEVCNKYFLRTHMLKMHGIVIDENKPVIANIDTRERERTGELSFRCDVCSTSLKSRIALREHKTTAHGVSYPPGMPTSPSTPRTPTGPKGPMSALTASPGGMPFATSPSIMPSLPMGGTLLDMPLNLHQITPPAPVTPSSSAMESALQEIVVVDSGSVSSSASSGGIGRAASPSAFPLVSGVDRPMIMFPPPPVLQRMPSAAAPTSLSFMPQESPVPAAAPAKLPIQLPISGMLPCEHCAYRTRYQLNMDYHEARHERLNAAGSNGQREASERRTRESERPKEVVIELSPPDNTEEDDVMGMTTRVAMQMLRENQTTEEVLKQAQAALLLKDAYQRRSSHACSHCSRKFSSDEALTAHASHFHDGLETIRAEYARNSRLAASAAGAKAKRAHLKAIRARMDERQKWTSDRLEEKACKAIIEPSAAIARLTVSRKTDDAATAVERNSHTSGSLSPLRGDIPDGLCSADLPPVGYTLQHFALAALSSDDLPFPASFNAALPVAAHVAGPLQVTLTLTPLPPSRGIN